MIDPRIARPGELVAYIVASVVVIVLASVIDAMRGWRYRKRPVPASVRRAVIERDGRCQNPWCRATRNLEADHRFPERRGGRATLANMQALCRRCNAVKGTRFRLPIVPRWLWWAGIEWRARWKR